MLSDDELRAVLIAEARRMAEQAGENPDDMTVDEAMLAQVMLTGRAVERAAYERAAQECDEWAKHCQATIGGPLGAYREGKADAASTLAERIRALGRQQ